jgi:hypothetical protein
MDVACLIAAITDANTSRQKNEIRLEAGVYALSVINNTTDRANGLPAISGELTIRGAGADLTIIERNANAPFFRLVHVSAVGTFTLEGLTLSGGRPDGGGGIMNHGTLTLSHRIVAGNTSEFGGGGIVNSGTLTLTHSVVAGNHFLSDGGAIGNDGTVTLVHSVLADNRALFGGGLFSDGGTLSLVHSVLTDNQADYGGGFLNEGGEVTVTDSTLARNRVYYGGGFLNEGGEVTVTDSTLANNQALYGGGLLDSSSYGMVGTVVLNTILAQNIASALGSDCLGTVTSWGYNLIGDPSDCTITLQPGDLTGNPGLANFADDSTPGNGHFPLLSTSRAMNAGNDSTCPKTDQLGEKRDKPCDIGAIEFQEKVVSSR